MDTIIEVSRTILEHLIFRRYWGFAGKLPQNAKRIDSLKWIYIMKSLKNWILPTLSRSEFSSSFISEYFLAHKRILFSLRIFLNLHPLYIQNFQNPSKASIILENRRTTRKHSINLAGTTLHRTLPILTLLLLLFYFPTRKLFSLEKDDFSIRPIHIQVFFYFTCFPTPHNNNFTNNFLKALRLSKVLITYLQPQPYLRILPLFTINS